MSNTRGWKGLSNIKTIESSLFPNDENIGAFKVPTVQEQKLT